MKTRLDATDRAFLDLSDEERWDLIDWLTENGIDPDRTHSVKLLAEGEALAYVCPPPHDFPCLDLSGAHWVLFQPKTPPPESWPYFEEE